MYPCAIPPRSNCIPACGKATFLLTVSIIILLKPVNFRFDCTASSVGNSFVFLAFRQKYQLEVVGTAVVSRAGGQQYFLISKNASDAKGCFGKTMATDHADDPRFIERVVSGKAFVLGDFQLVETQRPLQAIKKVLTGEAECALIDDAQMAELPHIEGAEGIRSVWESGKFPSMTLVAFGSTPPADRKKFKDGLSRVCDGEGKTACAEVGIMALSAADASGYNPVLAAYGK